MPTIKRIDHIAILVENIDAALSFWRDTLGLELKHVEDATDQQAIVAFLPTGESEVELVRPTSKDSGVARYLSKHGPGMHHICFEVDDINAYLGQLKEKGVRLINETPVIGTGGKKIAFVHPESTYGVLVEIYELTPQEPEIRQQRASHLAERVLEGGFVLSYATLSFLRSLFPSDDKTTPAKEETNKQTVNT